MLFRSHRDRYHELAVEREGNARVFGAIGSRSAVIFDLDLDGDLDIVTNDFHSEPMVLVSNLSERQPGRTFLAIRLKGSTSNRDGLGSVVRLRIGNRWQTQVCDGISGYLSQSSLPLYFGLHESPHVDELRIQWPSGIEQILSGPIAANQLVTVEEPVARHP